MAKEYPYARRNGDGAEIPFSSRFIPCEMPPEFNPSIYWFSFEMTLFTIDQQFYYEYAVKFSAN